jgi:hypothetical protein
MIDVAIKRALRESVAAALSYLVATEQELRDCDFPSADPMRVAVRRAYAIVWRLHLDLLPTLASATTTRPGASASQQSLPNRLIQSQ